MTTPQRPSPPTQPDEANPSTFQGRADETIGFLPTLVDYIADNNDFTEEQAELAAAVAIVNLITSGQLSAMAGELLGVNSAGDALEGYPIVTQRAIATEAQATAGTSNTVEMTPLRVRNVVDALQVETLGTDVVMR